MQASQILEIVIVTLHPFGCCSTIKYLTLLCSFKHRTSLLPYLSLSFTLFSFQGADRRKKLHSTRFRLRQKLAAFRSSSSSSRTRFTGLRSDLGRYSVPASFEARFEDPIFRLGLQIQQQITVWWARVGSNHRPYDYQSYALAS